MSSPRPIFSPAATGPVGHNVPAFAYRLRRGRPKFQLSLAGFFTLIGLFFTVSFAWGQIPSTLEKERGEKPAVTSLGEGKYRVGSVLIDQPQRTASFDSKVNLRDVLIEYAIVGKTGKLHESLLVCNLPPYDLHVAMLLLGAKDLRPESLKTTHPPGHPVRITLRWEEEGRERRARLEDWIVSESDGRPMAPGPWIYSGARIVDGYFTARRDESIVAIILDMDALVNNPRPGNQNDEIWHANAKQTPPIGTPARVTIQLLDDYPAPASAQTDDEPKDGES